MSIDEYSQGSTDSGGGKAEQAKDVARTAAQEASGVVSGVGEGTRQVAGEVAGQASVVVGEARAQLQSLVGQTKDELGAQLSSRGEQAAGGLRSLSGQLQALADGRPGDAGPLAGYVGEARGRVEAFARRLDEGGPQGVLDDVTAFARRRPGVFLAGAALAGLVVGRAVRAGAAANKEGLVHTGTSSPSSVSSFSSPSTSSSFSSPSPSSPSVGGTLPPPTGDDLAFPVAGEGVGWSESPVVAGGELP
jgi:hypothetical protein